MPQPISRLRQDQLFGNRDYRLLLIIGLLWGSYSSQLSFLAVVYRGHGFGDQAIAWIFTAVSAGVLSGGILSGSLITRIGARSTLVIGMLGALLSVIGLPVSGMALPAVLVLSLAQGTSAGMIMPPGFLMAQGLAAETDRVRAVGIFNASFLLPLLYGPTIAEWAWRGWGDGWFFTLALLPALAALLSAIALPSDQAPRSKTAGYLAVLRDRRILIPCLAMLGTGLAYAFANRFVALLIHPVGWFFTPFAVGLFVTRFIGLGYLQRMPARLLASLGLAAYIIGFFALLIDNPIIAGAVWGYAYGVVGPTAIAWGSALYAQTARARPVALVNLSFQVGSILAAQTVAAVLPTLGWSGLLLSFAAVLMLIVLACAAPAIARREHASAARMR